MDDDPFVIVKPELDNKKMSSYLRKQQGNAGPKCPETSSQSTSSTRSTTASTAPDDSGTMFTKTPEQSTRKTTKNTTSDSAAIEFNSDFGNGLEFGQGFGNASFGDDGFGTAQSPIKKERNRNLGSSVNAFDAFDSDPFSGSDGFGGGGGGDAFGGGDSFGDSAEFNAAFGADVEEPINFGDGFGTNAFPPTDQTPASQKDEAWRKREVWKNSARSKSGVSSRPPHGDRRRGGAPPRRHHSTDCVDILSSAVDQSPTQPTRRERPTGQDRHYSPNRRGAERSPNRKEKDRAKSPPRRQRSNRRERRQTLNHSTSNENGEHKQADLRPRRRASLANRSDGAMEKVQRSPAPARQKSAMERPRRRRSGENISADPAAPANGGSNKKNWENERSRNQEQIMNMYRDGGMKKSDNDNKNDSYGSIDVDLDSMEGMQIQDEMDGSSGGVGKRPILNFIKRNAPKNQFGASLGDDDDHEETPAQEQRSRKTKAPAEQGASKSNYGDRREDRTKTTLLERVAGELPVPSSSPGGTDSRGISYSDRIMMAQQRSKRN